jgi:hypothetical protein
MKKINYLLMLFVTMAVLMTNCKDDDNGGVIPPVDTLMWDYKLDYPVEIAISAVSYEGVKVNLDFATIASHLGITKDELLQSMAGTIDEPDVTLYAIGGPGTSDVEVGTPSNTNGIWGHWWDANGLLTTWGETAMVFAEYLAGDEFISIGQYPGRLTVGQVVEFYECIKYNDIRVACHFIVKAKAAEVIQATIVNTQALSIEVLEKSTYEMDSVQFNLTQTLTDLGVASMEEVKLIGVNADGSFAQEKSADNGYWINREGFVSSWGAGAVVYTDYKLASGSSYVGIGQFPDSLKAGQEFTIKFGFLANNKIEMLAITIKVAGYIDPETPPAGNPSNLTLTVAMNQPYNTAYTSVQFDVKETLREAFKMTTYQIHKAINSGELRLYQGAVADTAPGYTADAPGYWLSSEGNVTTWGNDSKIWCSLGHTETALYLYGGNHPDIAATGDVIVTKYIATCNGGSATFDITYKVE